MKTTIFTTLAACLAIAFAGCTPKEDAAASGDPAKETPAATNATAPESKGTGATAALAKCDGCGAEAKLTAHDTQNLCAKCIESHGH